MDSVQDNEMSPQDPDSQIDDPSSEQQDQPEVESDASAEDADDASAARQREAVQERASVRELVHALGEEAATKVRAASGRTRKLKAPPRAGAAVEGADGSSSDPSAGPEPQTSQETEDGGVVVDDAKSDVDSSTSKRKSKGRRKKDADAEVVGEAVGEVVGEDTSGEPGSDSAAKSATADAHESEADEDAHSDATDGDASERASKAGVQLVDSLPMDEEDDLSSIEGEASPRLVSIVESLLFCASKPLTVKDIRRVLDETSTKQVQLALKHLLSRTSDHGVILSQVAGGFVLRTHPDNASWVQRLLQAKPTRLSRPQLETLAVIAYRQPVTRPELDHIRGVDSAATIKLLLERELVQIVGRKEEPGRPNLFGTTVKFLEFFNLRSLRDLPDLRDLRSLSDASERDARASAEAAREVLGQQRIDFDAVAKDRDADEATSHGTSESASQDEADVVADDAEASSSEESSEDAPGDAGEDSGEGASDELDRDDADETAPVDEAPTDPSAESDSDDSSSSHDEQSEE